MRSDPLHIAHGHTQVTALKALLLDYVPSSKGHVGLQALHRYFRCMAYDQSESRLVIVGEDGHAGKAQTSQQLAAALSVSVWDLSNMQQPLLLCTTGSKQVPSLLQGYCFILPHCMFF